MSAENVLPMLSGTQRAQAEVPGARLWVRNPQFGNISRGVHRKEKPGHRFCDRDKRRHRSEKDGREMVNTFGKY